MQLQGLDTHVIHHLLEALAEGAPSNSQKALLSLREGDGPNARCHPKLLHHGIGNTSDLPQVVLCPWSMGSRKGFFAEGAESGHLGEPTGTHQSLTADAESPEDNCILLQFLKRQSIKTF